MYYSNNSNWYVGKREDMEIGKAQGWVHSQPTPAEVPFGDDLTWQVHDGSSFIDWPSARCASISQPLGTCAATVVCGECATSPPPRMQCCHMRCVGLIALFLILLRAY